MRFGHYEGYVVVIIPKYLSLSSHHNENTKPPLFLGREFPNRFSQQLNFHTTSPLKLSKKYLSEFRNSLWECPMYSDREDELKMF